MDLDDAYCSVCTLYSNEEQDPSSPPKTDIPDHLSMKFEVTQIYNFDQTHNWTAPVGTFEVPKDQVFQEHSPKDNICNILSTMDVPLYLHESIISRILACTRNITKEEHNKLIGMFVSIFVTCFDEMDDDELEAMVENNYAFDHYDRNVNDYDSSNGLERFLEDDAMVTELNFDDQLHNSGLVPASKESIEGLEKVKVEGSRGHCSICLEDFEDGCEVTRTPCSHVYHGDCIVNWLHNNNLCPLCRFVL
ncbi:RING/U-box superfamily protein [Quillaja saponaria]|uniref:RING-type E3 ubiquitin transferase n=1 Tax=Quillaja saponaria TaxID=32244 RepID=A0AAD7VND4_QUISA|nr:RING/U-box superfamily protein [Quillaja saponaria]